MKDEIRMAICEVVVRGTKHCSTNCRCLKACHCWRGFKQEEGGAEEIKADSKGRLIRRKACIAAEMAAKKGG